MAEQVNGNEALIATAQRGGVAVANLLAELGMRDALVAALTRQIEFLKRRVAELENPELEDEIDP